MNNDVLRRLRYILNFADDEMIETFLLGGTEVSRSQVSSWLKKDDAPDFLKLEDRELAAFLNGLIIKKRGAKEGNTPEPESRLNNNIVLRKLMIAFSLRSDDVVTVLQLADFKMSKSEVGAFFRKPGHRNFRKCMDQVLRNFLHGLQVKLK
ncbi:MAG: hypothetical protein CME64_08810 [Halobacteriovoraceae bacterium]|nr:hypothetical protein [Halobacteriovoraceae bacterium]|tara:strand:- start:299523 stop:299975 length:453 start_codon:yes stop_codon:yes gene_type:complete